MEFDWDDGNEEHLARHGASRQDAEAILADPLGEIVDSELVDEEMRYRQIGSTLDGRILIVIFTMRGRAVRPVTGFEAGRFMARLYRHGFVQQDKAVPGLDEETVAMASKISDKIVVPHFATEGEEADWWFDNREEHDEIMAKAMAEGRTMTMKQLLDQHGLIGPRIAVKLDFEDLVEARRQSDARGLNYEVYVRQLLHEALERNGAA